MAEQSGWMMDRNPIHPICDGHEGNDQKKGPICDILGIFWPISGDF